MNAADSPACRELDEEPAAGSDVVDPHCSPVGPGDPADDVEPKAGALTDL
jgi:hypothetical protein